MWKHYLVLYLVTSSYLTSNTLFLASALSIIGSTTTLQSVDGHLRHLHKTGFQCDEYDVQLGIQEFNLTDNSGTVRRVGVKCVAPEYHFDSFLRGWLPKFQYPMTTKICRISVRSNSTLLGTDVKDGSNYPSPIGDVSDFTNGGARRLLEDHSDEALHAFQEFISLPDNRQKFMDSLPEQSRADWEQTLREAKPGSLRAGHIDLVKTYEPQPAGRKLLVIKPTHAQWMFGGLTGAYAAYKGARPIAKWKAKRRFNNLKRAQAAAKSSKQSLEWPKPSARINPTTGRTLVEDDLVAESSASAEVASTSAAEAAATAESEAALATAAEVGVTDLALGGALAGLGGIALGIGITMLLPHILGGGSDANEQTAALFRGLEKHIGQIDDELLGLRNFQDSQGVILSTLQNRFADQDLENKKLDSEIADVADAVVGMQSHVQRLDDQIQVVQNNQMQQYAEIGEEIDSLAAFDNELFNVTQKWHAESEVKFRQLFYHQSKLLSFLTRMEKDVAHLWYDTNMRRTASKTFHKLNGLTLPQGDVAPFLEYLGKPGLSDDEWDALKTPQGAFDFGSVYIQRTIKTGGIPWGQAYNITLVCDPLFLLDNLVPGMDFQTLFTFMGPAGCMDGMTSPTQEWGCTCALKVETIECRLVVDSQEHYYPWGNGTNPGLQNGWQGATWMDHVAVGGIDDNCLPTNAQSPANSANSDVITGDPNTFPANYLTNITDIMTFLRELCEDSHLVADPASGNKVRLHGQYWPRFTDLKLDAVEDPEVCNADFAKLFGHPLAYKRMAYAVYRIMSYNYASSLTGALADLEEHIYGRVPSGLNFERSPYNTDVKSSQTFECQSFTFMKISGGAAHTPGKCLDQYDPGPSCPKVRLYANEYVGMAGRIEVYIDDVLVTNHTLEPGTYGASQAFSSEIVGTSIISDHTEVTTDVSITDEANFFLKSSMLQVGPYPGRVISSVPVGGGSPEDSRQFFDVPWDMVSGSAFAQAREGHVDYIFQPVGVFDADFDSPINFTHWRTTYGTDFNAKRVGGSPHFYARRLVPPLEGAENVASLIENDFVCGDAYSDDGVSLVEPQINFDWCRLMRFWRVEPIRSDPEQIGLILRPRQFIATGWVTTPGGVFTQTIFSHCPSGVIVTNNTETKEVFVTFNTTAVEQVTVNVLLSSDNGACVQVLENRVYSSSQPLVVGPILYDAACGSTRYVDLVTLNNGETCYDSPGIPLNNNGSHFESNNRPAEITSAVAFVEDRTSQDIIEQTNFMSALSREIQDISDSSVDDDEIRARMDNLTARRIAIRETMKTRNDLALAKEEQYVKAAQEENAKVTEALIRQRTDAAASNKLRAQLKQDEVAFDNAVAVSLQLLRIVDGLDNATQAFRPTIVRLFENAIKALEAKDGGCGGSEGGLLGFLLVPLCALEDFLGKGLGELLVPIIHFVFIVLLVIVGLWLTVKLMECMIHGCCAGGCTSMFSGFGGKSAPIVTPQTANEGVPNSQVSSVKHLMSKKPDLETPAAAADAQPLVQPQTGTSSWYNSRSRNTLDGL